MPRRTQSRFRSIVPARNEEANLANCLQSLVGQQGVSYEVIVVDDHSTDRTREIAQSFPVQRDRGGSASCRLERQV